MKDMWKPLNGAALDRIIDRYTDKYMWPDLDWSARQAEEAEAWQAQLDRVCRVWALEDCAQQSGDKEIEDEKA